MSKNAVLKDYLLKLMRLVDRNMHIRFETKRDIGELTTDRGYVMRRIRNDDEILIEPKEDFSRSLVVTSLYKYRNQASSEVKQNGKWTTKQNLLRICQRWRRLRSITAIQQISTVRKS